MNEIERTIRTDKVEDCLNRCTNEPAFVCRSVSFNRTGRLCSLSAQSQATKPNSLRVNNNPNYRIDYYEHACANENIDKKVEYRRRSFLGESELGSHPDANWTTVTVVKGFLGGAGAVPPLAYVGIGVIILTRAQQKWPGLDPWIG
uniref:Apple domain-containing protein n=1 Tax=Romanomermis culicivorax TaxID=13658 RepID=A0A915L5U7_ROMCU